MTIRMCPTFRELAELYPNATIVVDVPIGLFEDPRPDGRECDQLARQQLGDRRSSVFTPPARRYLAAERFQEVSGMSIQSFSIRGKIKEIDDFITPTLQNRILEGHPEVSFKTLVGEPMRSGKKSKAGKLERRQALHTAPGDDFLQLDANPRAALQREGITNVKVDDLLDACIMLWTALRIVAGGQAGLFLTSAWARYLADLIGLEASAIWREARKLASEGVPAPANRELSAA